MAFKEAYVATPPDKPCFLHAWNAAGLLPSPDIEHLPFRSLPLHRDLSLHADNY